MTDTKVYLWTKNGWELLPLSDIKEFKKRGITIGDEVKLGDGVKLGDWVTLGDGVRLLKTPDTNTIIEYKNGYKYTATLYRSTEGVWYIQLGCYHRSIEEWDADFWNNPDEFPEGSDQAKERLMVFELLKGVRDLMVKGGEDE